METNNQLRAVLSDTVGVLESIYEAFSKGTGGVYMSDVAESIDNARAVLSASPRNCDVGTAEEQQERFREFCRRHNDAGECGIGRTHAKCPCWRGHKNPDCALSWAQMPCEEGEIDGSK